MKKLLILLLLPLTSLAQTNGTKTIYENISILGKLYLHTISQGSETDSVLVVSGTEVKKVAHSAAASYWDRQEGEINTITPSVPSDNITTTGAITSTYAYADIADYDSLYVGSIDALIMKSLTDEAVDSVFRLNNLTNGNHSTVYMVYEIEVESAAGIQTEVGTLGLSVGKFNNTLYTNVNKEIVSAIVSSGSLSVNFSAVKWTANHSVTLSVTANTSLSGSTITMRYIPQRFNVYSITRL